MRAEVKKKRLKDNEYQLELIEICHEMNSMQKQIYANINEHDKVVDAHSKLSTKKSKGTAPLSKLERAKAETPVKVVDLTDMTFELNYKDEYAFDNHKASTVQHNIKKNMKERKRRERRDRPLASKEQQADYSSSDYSSSDFVGDDLVAASKQKPSMKNMLDKLEMQEQKEIGESIRRYKNKLDLERKLNK